MIIEYIDFYKVDHRRQYPKGIERVFSNWTARKSRSGFNSVVFFGLQYFIKRYLINGFNFFFAHPKDVVIKEYRELLMSTLGTCPPLDHIEYLHRLRHVPLVISALPEGTLAPVGVPLLTIYNTDPNCYWLVNYLETLMSSILWKPSTSATTAYLYRKKFEEFADGTGADKGFIDFQGHDFSFRGMSGLEDVQLSGAGHLLSFKGTDSVPSIPFIKRYYGTGLPENYLIGTSVPATEHSVMCAHGKDDEIETFKYLLDLYPEGIVSVVSDTWDLWKVLDEYLPALKDKILARNGKLVIRPDSGDPVSITIDTVYKLWDTFGGTINSKGYRELDSHVGVLYGDSITLDRQEEILKRLESLGFASSNVVFGIGSYTYQYTTRDTYGFAMKATYAEVNGEPRNIWKDPVTDDGTKKSAKGLLALGKGFDLIQEATWDQVSSEENLLRPVFKNGKLLVEDNIETIRRRLHA